MWSLVRLVLFIMIVGILSSLLFYFTDSRILSYPVSFAIAFATDVAFFGKKKSSND